MDTENKLSKIHPLIAAAAIALIIACLVAIAAMVGVLPNFHKNAEPVVATSTTNPNEAAPTPSIAPMSAPENPPAPEQAPMPSSPPPVEQASPPDAQPYVSPPAPVYPRYQVARAPKVCANCGVVVAVRVVQQQRPTSGVGAGVGAVVGGLIGNQFGSGGGRALTTVAGAVGGGYVGNEIERNSHTATSYEVIVRMDNGRTRSFMTGANRWRNGDLVRVERGALTPR